jgi:hypothetical protein
MVPILFLLFLKYLLNQRRLRDLMKLARITEHGVDEFRGRLRDFPVVKLGHTASTLRGFI